MRIGKIGIGVMCVLAMAATAAAESAPPEEIVAKLREAAAFLSEKGADGIPEFNDPKGRWVWKDTYVFVHDCSQGLTVAHPIIAAHIGKRNIAIRDVKGNMFFVQGCEAAKKPKGGWIEYWWPKPGEKDPSRKISLMLAVPDTPYEVGAGVYNDAMSIPELEKLLD